MHSRFPTALAAAASLVAGTAAAQKPDSASLPAVVVTATRVDGTVGAGILAASVLDRATLERLGVRDVSEALRLVTGVSIVRSGGAGAQTSIFLRGGENDFVRVLLDGVPLNEPGGAVDLAWLSLDDVERIEVVRGPASVLYGSDAVSGVVQVFTRRGDGATSAEAGLATGRYEMLATRGTVTLGSRAGGLLLGASRERSDGILPFNNGYDRAVVTGSAQLRPAGATTAGISIRRVQDEYHFPTDGAGHVEDRNALRRGRRLVTSATLGQVLTGRVRGELTVAAMDGRGTDDDRADSPADTTGFYHYDANTAVRRRLVDARLHLGTGPAALITLGAELSRESQHGDDSSNYSATRSNFAARRRTLAAYGQWLADLGPLSVTAGVRQDDNDVFGTFRTWRGGLALRGWRGGTLRATAATAFKAPTFLETFTTAFSTGNGDLAPERSRSWEVGAQQRVLGGRLEVAATWFDQRFRDLIQYAFVSPELPNYFNVAAASARGLEAEATMQVAPRLRAAANATFLRTRVEDEGLQSGEAATFVRGGRLLRRPGLAASGTVQLGLPGRAAVDLAIRHTGDRDDRDFSTFPATPVTLPAYTRVDVGFTGPASAEWTGGELQFQLRLENVLGARYQEVANYPAPGRALTVGLRMRTR